jgi:hypothetical protein
MEHQKVESGSEEENAKLTSPLVRVAPSAGPEPMVVSGAKVSALPVSNPVSVALAVAAMTPLIVRAARAAKIAVPRAATTLLVANLYFICPTLSPLQGEALRF